MGPHWVTLSGMTGKGNSELGEEGVIWWIPSAQGSKAFSRLPSPHSSRAFETSFRCAEVTIL